MMLAVTGATGLVGRFIVEDALRRGQAVTVLGRTPPSPGFFSGAVGFQAWELGGVPELRGFDGLVHAAFSHVPGLYRGGEGDDPTGFMKLNLDGSVRLFAAAVRAGMGRVVFLSSRAVYDGLPLGTALDEAMEIAPDSLYGRAKLEAEQALAATGRGVSLRATGVYGPAGPGQVHKWAGLFADFRAGRAIAPRVATEVLGSDLAAAVQVGLASGVTGVLNVSDLLLDRRGLLAEVAALTGWDGVLPERSGAVVSTMQTGRLEALGWRASGLAGLRAALPAMIAGS
ncbi:MAG: NAD(P)-dependent oxidoreductase [Rhodobacterales bacterium]|jgi:UDP-glucose 4-epimerase|nr:NAD(P)-dependent oxidoreductase [Rhodobacterales bacterium]